MFGEEGPNLKCVRCGTPLEDKWITIWEIGDLCVYCAQHTMRILLEDIIEYHNGQHVSLLNIMYHGDKEEMEGMLKEDKQNKEKRDKQIEEHLAAQRLEEQLEEQYEEQYEEQRAKLDEMANKLFDFENVKDESGK